MAAQLNRFMALFALCGLLTRPAMADSERSQRLIVDGDTLTVQMAEPLPAGLQTLVVDGDTLTVQVLGEPSTELRPKPRPAYKSPLAASGDSLSALKTFPQAAVGDSAEHVARFLVQAGSVDDMDPDKRVAKKLSYGALGGVGGGSVGAVMGFALGFGACSDCDRDGHDGCDLCGLGPIVGSVIVGSIGCSIGTAVGVSRVDPHDLFGASLIGSVVGLVGGIGLVSASESELLFPSILIGPVVGATLASEWSRSLNPLDKKLPFFMNLVPDSRGRLAAIATLRF